VNKSRDSDTLAFYNKKAEWYVGVRPEAVADHLDEFLSLLPAKAKILELGCGGGVDTQYMIGQGFDVTAVDGSVSMAAIAEKRIGKAVAVMSFDELDFQDEYDGIVATASLLHIPRAELPSIISKIHRALHPGGWHVATLKTGGNEGRDEFGRYYNRPSRSQLETIYAGAGIWADMHFAEYSNEGHVGKPSRWIKVTVQKDQEV